MSASVLDQTQLDDTDTDDPSKHSHYINQRVWDVARAMIEGTEIEAICGYRFVPFQDMNAFPICQRCQELFYEADPTKRPSEL